MPYALSSSAMAESPDGKGVILFGGQRYDNQNHNHWDENRILELRAGADSWNILDVSLKNGRLEHVVIPLP